MQILNPELHANELNEIKLIAENGVCHGWSVSIIAMNNEEILEFYDDLKKLSIWDGSEETLKKDKTLQKLFEVTLRKLVTRQEIKKPENTIFKFGFLLREHEIEAILMTLFQYSEKIEIGCFGNSLRHSIVIRKMESGEFVIYDNNSKIGPIQGGI